MLLYLPFKCSFSEPSPEHVDIIIIKIVYSISHDISEWGDNDIHELFNLFSEQLLLSPSPLFFCNWLTMLGIKTSWGFQAWFLRRRVTCQECLLLQLGQCNIIIAHLGHSKDQFIVSGDKWLGKTEMAPLLKEMTYYIRKLT